MMCVSTWGSGMREKIHFNDIVKIVRAVRPDAVEAFIANTHPSNRDMYYNYVDGMFVWTVTPEGRKYWCGVMREVEDYLTTWYD